MSDLHLYVYDISKGMARQFSAMFLGKHFDGVWHTGVVAFGKEWFFGNDGIDYCEPKGTILGNPDEIILLGKTDLNEQDFMEIIRQLSEGEYKVGTYNLLEHNCNNFSNDLSTLVVGKSIPSHIVDLPKEILNTPLGPMLKPLLEQAADPIHQYRSGNPGGFTTKLNNILNNRSNTASNTASNTSTKTEEHVPSTVILYKPDIKTELSSLLDFCQSRFNINNNNLLAEIKDYLQQTEIRWSIAPNHIKLLFDAYLNQLSDINHKITIIKIIQLVSLDKNVADLIVKNKDLFEKIFPDVKKTQILDLKYNLIQAFSNIASHRAIGAKLLEEHQDKIFSELSDLTLLETNNDIQVLIHESHISLFFNLISAYHLEPFLNESNAMTLGCALLERLPKLKSKPKTIYQMLSLLRSCLSNSQSMRELAVSMDFDLSKYQLTDKEKTTIGSETTTTTTSVESAESTQSKNDTYESVICNIDNLIHSKK